MADDAAEARAAATQEAPDGLREKVQVMDNLIETVTFFRNTDPNVSLIVIGIMLTWTLAAGSFLLARVTCHSVDRLGLGVGTPVFALVKSVAFDRVFPGPAGRSVAL